MAIREFDSEGLTLATHAFVFTLFFAKVLLLPTVTVTTTTATLSHFTISSLVVMAVSVVIFAREVFVSS